MNTLSFTLPDTLHAFVQQQATRHGCGSGEYLCQLVTREQEREALAARAARMMASFCTTVTRCEAESGEGEIVLGLDENNRELCRVRLDPYDIGTYSALTDPQMLRRLKEQKPQ